jgi:hypothetical protein
VWPTAYLDRGNLARPHRLTILIFVGTIADFETLEE